MGRQVPLLHISAGSQFRNTFKSSKKSETYILAGVLRFTMNVDCSAPAVSVRRNRVLQCIEICE